MACRGTFSKNLHRFVFERIFPKRPVLEDRGGNDDGEGYEPLEGDGAIDAISSTMQGDGSHGAAVLGDCSRPGETQKLFRTRLLQQAVKAGDDDMVRVLRHALSATTRKTQGRSSEMYGEVAAKIKHQRFVAESEKRDCAREDRQLGMLERENNRQLTMAEIRRANRQESKRGALAEATYGRTSAEEGPRVGGGGGV